MIPVYTTSALLPVLAYVLPVYTVSTTLCVCATIITVQYSPFFQNFTEIFVLSLSFHVVCGLFSFLTNKICDTIDPISACGPIIFIYYRVFMRGSIHYYYYPLNPLLPKPKQFDCFRKIGRREFFYELTLYLFICNVLSASFISLFLKIKY